MPIAGPPFVSVRISARTVSEVPGDIQHPRYDRRALGEGVVHFGVGNFHRSHQAPYLEDAMVAERAFEWGICGVGLLRSDRALHAALTAQDGLYTLIERDAEHASARVIGALKRHLLASSNPNAVFEAVAAPLTRLVTLTITEGAYRAHGTNGLDFAHPDVQHDLRRRWRPKTIYGFLAEGLDRRRLRGIGPVSVVSCDDFPDNGRVVHRALVEFASTRCGELGRWIDECVTFPNSMVDRITPASSEAEQEFLKKVYGIQDACPVASEAFRQWVLEDTFAAGRPPLERAGVLFTGDVTAYQEAKSRLLCASQSALGYLGYLAGYRFVHEVSSSKDFVAYVAALMDDEVTPLLAPLPGLDLQTYKRVLRQRFANGAVADPLLRICEGGSAKIPQFVLPSIREQLARGGPVAKLCLCVAAWLRFLQGVDEQGRPIPILDEAAGQLVEAMRLHAPDPLPALEIPAIFGDLAREARFVDEIARFSRVLHERGARAALAAALS